MINMIDLQKIGDGSFIVVDRTDASQLRDIPGYFSAQERDLLLFESPRRYSIEVEARPDSPADLGVWEQALYEAQRGLKREIKKDLHQYQKHGRGLPERLRRQFRSIRLGHIELFWTGYKVFAAKTSTNPEPQDVAVITYYALIRELAP